MQKPISREHIIASQSSSSSRDRAQKSGAVAFQSLPAAEIESLLRLARGDGSQLATDALGEELGPGDVQYLRGNSMTHSNTTMETATESNWPESTPHPDSLLQQAEQQLAEAILNSGDESLARASQGINVGMNPGRPRSSEASQQGLTLEDLGDLDLDITIELGRTEILIEDVLKLREGSVVSLDKLAGDPVDIVANGRLVARGELLVIDGKFGVRLSEVL